MTSTSTPSARSRARPASRRPWRPPQTERAGFRSLITHILKGNRSPPSAQPTPRTPSTTPSNGAQTPWLANRHGGARNVSPVPTASGSSPSPITTPPMSRVRRVPDNERNARRDVCHPRAGPRDGATVDVYPAQLRVPHARGSGRAAREGAGVFHGGGPHPGDHGSRDRQVHGGGRPP